jgi:V/A-type H+-transporting ATPase subunit K
MEEGIRFLAAALAVGLGAIGTGVAQARIGSAGAGAVAEKPQVTGTIFILVALPETMVILGFVIGAMILFQ